MRRLREKIRYPKDARAKWISGRNADQQNQQQGGQPQQNKEKKQPKEKETSTATLEDVKKVTKDMIDMSGAKEIIEGATKRFEKEKAKETEKAQKKALDAAKSGDSKSEDKEEYKSWKDVETKKDNRSTDNELYADKPAKVKYDVNNNSTYTTEGSSDKPYKWDKATREATSGESTFVQESKGPKKKVDDYKVTYDYNNDSTYTTEGSSDKPYKWNKETRESTAGSSTFRQPTATEEAIDRASKEYSTQSRPTKSSNASTQKLEIFYDSNPNQFSKKEQKEFSSAIASVTSILRSIGSSTPSGKIDTKPAKQKSSSDAIGRLKQNKEVWDAVANSVPPEVLADAEKISKATTEYTYDLLEKNMKILNKYTK